MIDRLEDRLSIASIINGWMHRDLGEWDKLLELFHSDGVIEVTWFEGLFSDFVAASRKMGGSSVRTKHIISSPTIRFNMDKAIVETNAVIVVDNAMLDVGASCHNRFFDMLEKRDGAWKITKRQSIYDMGSFMFPFGPVEIDVEIARRYPREYAPLAYMLEKSGFPVKRIFATKGSELEKEMREAAMKWLGE